MLYKFVKDKLRRMTIFICNCASGDKSHPTKRVYCVRLKRYVVGGK